MREFFAFWWDSCAGILNLLRSNLVFDLGTFSVSFFDIVFVLMFFYLIMKFFLFRH